MISIDVPYWYNNGACNGKDLRMFFPTRGESSAPAKAVCAECDYRIECLAYAIDNGIFNGIWGGTAENERKRMRRRARGGFRVVA